MGCVCVNFSKSIKSNNQNTFDYLIFDYKIKSVHTHTYIKIYIQTSNKFCQLPAGPHWGEMYAKHLKNQKIKKIKKNQKKSKKIKKIKKIKKNQKKSKKSKNQK